MVGKNSGSYLSNFASVDYSAKLLISLDFYKPNRNASYDCSRESSQCVRDCKIAAGNYLTYEKIKTSDQPVSTMDMFYDFGAASQVCRTINKAVQAPGVDVFLRFTSGTVVDQLAYEDLHLGRICCNDFLFPANKCKYPLLPTINSTFIF